MPLAQARGYTAATAAHPSMAGLRADAAVRQSSVLCPM